MKLVLQWVLLLMSQVMGAPENCSVYLGDTYCMHISPAAQQRQAVQYCYELWDLANLTVWQSYHHHPGLFHELRRVLLELGVHHVWLEAEARHEGGLYLHTFPANSLFNTPVAGLDLSSGRTSSERCLTWDVLAMVHRPRDCWPSSPRRFFPAVCLALQAPVRTATVGCPPSFYVAPRIVHKCVYVQRSDNLVGRKQATHVCEAMHTLSRVVQLGYRTLVSGEYGTCPVGLRKIVNGLGEVRYLWDSISQDLEEVDGVTLENVLSANTSASEYLGAVSTGSNPLLFLVADNFTFSCVACEVPLPPLVTPQLTLTASSENGSLHILLDVKHGSTLLTERSNDDDTRERVKLRCFTDATSFYPQSVSVTRIHGSRYSLQRRGDGYYWCHAQDVFTLRPVSSNSVLVGRSAALQTWAVLVRANCTVLGRYVSLPRLNLTDVQSTSCVTWDDGWLRKLGSCLARHSYDLKLKRIYRNGTLFLVHIAQKKEMDVLLADTRVDGVAYTIVDVRNVDHCPYEETSLASGLLRWPESRIGETVLLEKDCTQFSRVCGGNFNDGARWSRLAEHRHSCSATSETWQHLRDEDEVQASSPVTFTEDSPVVQEVHPEILKAASSLHELAGSHVSKTTLLSAVDIFDKVLDYDISTMVSGRAAGSEILQNMDTILRNAEVQEEFLTVVKKNTAVFVSGESSEGQIAGISFSTTQQVMRGKRSGIETSRLDVIRYSQTDSFLTKESNIDVAVVFSESVSKLKPRMSAIIFGNSSLLVPASNGDVKNVLNSKVVGVIMKGKDRIFKEDSESFVNIIFKPHNVFGKKMCVYWDFDTWSWETRGCEMNSSLGLDICHCNHVTYFAEMIAGGIDVLSSTNQMALDVISITGCTLSLVGLLGICVTAVVLPSWRRLPGNQLLLSLSAAVGLKMVLFLVVAVDSASRGMWCVVVGAGLHYTLLVSFCWMLLIAVLQYKRLVSVLGRPYPSRLLLKGSFFCWGVPSVPVILLLVIDPGLYTTRTGYGLQRKFCYPSGVAFYLAVVLPVTIVTLFNVSMFFTIIMNISNCVKKVETKAYGVSSRKTHLYRALTSLLLFFLLGTTWVFGLLAEITLFAYIFCITATLQGAVLFLFFVAGSQRTHSKWSIRKATFGIKNRLKTTSTTTRTSSTRRTESSDVHQVREMYVQKHDVN